MSRAYSRVTLVGTRRRVDVVLPADEAVGAMTGELVRVLDEPASSPPLHRYLVDPKGEVLGGSATLASARIEDGAVLRLVGEEGLPPAPVVYDVAEEAASDRDSRRFATTPRHRQVIGGVAFTVVMGTTAAVLGMLDAPPISQVSLALASVLIGILLGRLGHGPLSASALAAGAAVGAHVVLVGELTASWPAWHRWAALAAVVVLTPLLFALAGSPPRGALLGTGVGTALLLLWTGGMLLHLPATRTAAVLAVVSVAALGFLPRAALMVSGVASLDDKRAAGHRVTRRNVDAALASAHEGLVLASAATAASAAVAGVVLSTEHTWFTVPLGCLLAFLLLSRARVFPLVLETVPVAAAGAVTAVAFIHSWTTDDTATAAGPLLVLVALAAAALFTVGMSLPEHAAARLRIVLDRVEMLAVIAMVPLLPGVFGTYSRLLEMF